MFWESSALCAILLEEAASAVVIDAFDRDTKPTIWWGTPVEAHSLLARGVREKRVTRDDALTGAERLRVLRVRTYEIQPTEDIRTRAVRLLAVHRLRAADALQLAAALIWCEEQTVGETFVCLDKRLREAAHQEGFTLLPAD